MLMVVKHDAGKKCPQCGEVLVPRINEDEHVEYVCESCGYSEVDNRSLDVDIRLMPTFRTLPVVKI